MTRQLSNFLRKLLWFFCARGEPPIDQITRRLCCEDWGPNVAVVDPDTGKAFALDGSKRWWPVKSADVSWHGKLLSEAAARSGYARWLAAAGEPPVSSLREPPVSPTARSTS